MFSINVDKRPPISNLTEIRPVVTMLIYADKGTDGQMDRPADMMKLISGFSDYANAPKTGQANLQISFSV